MDHDREIAEFMPLLRWHARRIRLFEGVLISALLQRKQLARKKEEEERKSRQQQEN